MRFMALNSILLESKTAVTIILNQEVLYNYVVLLIIVHSKTNGLVII